MKYAVEVHLKTGKIILMYPSTAWQSPCVIIPEYSVSIFLKKPSNLHLSSVISSAVQVIFATQTPFQHQRPEQFEEQLEQHFSLPVVALDCIPTFTSLLHSYSD